MRTLVAVAVLSSIVSCKTEAPSTITGDKTRRAAAVPTAAIIREAKEHARGRADTKPADVELAPGIFGIPEGSRFRISTVERESDDPTIAGAISPRRMLHEFREYAAVFQPGITASDGERDACKAAWLERGGVLNKIYNWVVAFRLVGDGRVTRVTEVHSLRDHWPEVFDDEIKDCYLASFARISFDSALVVDMTVEFPLCVQPKVTEIEERKLR